MNSSTAQSTARRSILSRSPYGDEFHCLIDYEREKDILDSFPIPSRKTIVVQGLGFVGSAMAAALAGATHSDGDPLYNVIGVDLPDNNNFWKIMRINNGKPPVLSSDNNIIIAYNKAHNNKNLIATFSDYAFSKSDVVVVDINLDITRKEPGKASDYSFSYDHFSRAIKTIADNIHENTLVVLESTVPPATTEQIVYPIFKDAFIQRGLDINKLCLSYSYERVMPGPSYLNSIVNFYRVFSGINPESTRRTRDFFESFINTKDYPLCEVHSTTAAEMAKVLENSFRAMNIAFIQEWTEFAENAQVNLFQVIDAIRMRPTHKNIMLPGFGVGGYCLTKDPLLADWSYRNLYHCHDHLAMSVGAIATNDMMPDHTFRLLQHHVHSLSGKSITILGVSYLGDVSDTRHSPTERFYDRCFKEGARLHLHDPMVTFWAEKNLPIDNDINALKTYQHDIAVFVTRHSIYLNMNWDDILNILTGVQLIIDANNIISDATATCLAAHGIKMLGVGKGHWNRIA